MMPISTVTTKAIAPHSRRRKAQFTGGGGPGYSSGGAGWSGFGRMLRMRTKS
jgi:hypothetical protein